MQLKNKTAIVTGGGTGIGRGIARVLSSRGANIVICGRTESRLQETQLQLREEDRSVESYVCDVTDRGSVRSMCEAVGATFKTIDILVDNAGLGGPNFIDEGDEQLWDSILESNLKGPFLCSSEVLKWMPEGGRIINLSSVLGKFGVPGYTAYCSSKHGIVGFTRALALELAARRITVNAICPGWVDTAMARLGMEAGAQSSGVTYEEFRAGALENVPLKEMLQPEEIGEMVCFLVSEAGKNITGQAYNICGGQVMH